MEVETQMAERLLIYQNDTEIKRITQEAQTRASTLNRIAAQNFSLSQIERVANSLYSVGQYILEQQLKENDQLKNLHEAGIKVTAELPEHLQRLKEDLTSWHNYKGPVQNKKLVFLKVNESGASVDEEALEKHFVQRQLKVFVEGEQLEEFKKLESICEYFENNGMESGQVRACGFLWSRIEPAGANKYKPRWQWFMHQH